MHRRLLVIFAGLAAIAAPLTAQQYQQQRARIIGNGNLDQGKCTIEVMVDGVAEVEVRGDTASLRNLSGQPAQWRRFECTGRMPPNPADFRFAGVDGRGRQTLIRDPRNGGVAVVRIEDPQGGAEGYTFDLMWSGGTGPYTSGVGPYNRGNYGNGNYGQYSADAVRACEDSVRQQAYDRFNSRDVSVQTRNAQDNPGPRDTIYGTVNIRGGGLGRETHDFSCMVNMNTGRILSTRIDPGSNGQYRQYGDRGPISSLSNSAAIENCQRAVRDRMRRDGYAGVQFDSINADDRPGRNDWIVGTARSGRELFNFSCSVNMDSGSVRSVDMNRR
jgi:hypothetical protein